MNPRIAYLLLIAFIAIMIVALALGGILTLAAKLGG